LYLKEISSILLEKSKRSIDIVDPAVYAVEELLGRLKDMGMIREGTGKIEFFTTGDAYEFREKAIIFLNRPIKVKHINLKEEGEVKLWQK
jgi:glutamate racemase